jgi:hypothetical protein
MFSGAKPLRTAAAQTIEIAQTHSRLRSTNLTSPSPHSPGLCPNDSQALVGFEERIRRVVVIWAAASAQRR